MACDVTENFSPFTGQTFTTPNEASFAHVDHVVQLAPLLPSFQTVAVSGARLSGSAMTAWWYNPSDGVATQIGTYSTTGTLNSPPKWGLSVGIRIVQNSLSLHLVVM